MSGVDRVVPISRPYKLASSELYHEGPSVFDIGGRRVGGGDTFCLIAGPCTVESREQTLEVARTVAAAGAAMLRGGALHLLGVLGELGRVELLRQQVVITVRHELAHHIGFDELGVRDLGL